jgi:secreted trypsin-like serine protease
MRVRLDICLSLVGAVFMTSIGTIEAVFAQQEIKPFNRRIVGGENTDIKQHPWQVALQFNGRFFCGGSVIGQKWIVTAAHCFAYSTQGSDWRAKAGVSHYSTQGVWSEVERVIVHENYDSQTNENDIALIKLKLSAAGRVIPLAAASLQVPVGQPLEVTGWGATEELGEGSKDLLKASVPVADMTACNVPSAYSGRIRPSMICAGYREGGVDACQGDSGGPLVWNTSDGPVLVGVVSWGEGCARKLKYGIYTRVSDYRDWIDRTIASVGIQ